MEPTAEQIQLWFHYEEIAMHFNELILQYRLQLMGGVGVIGALSSYLIGNNVSDISQRSWLRFLVASGLLVLIVAAAALDVFYYNQLLIGAVDAIKKYEAAHPAINMSTIIDEKVTRIGVQAVYITYAIVILPLLAFVLWSAWAHFRNKTKQA